MRNTQNKWAIWKAGGRSSGVSYWKWGYLDGNRRRNWLQRLWEREGWNSSLHAKRREESENIRAVTEMKMDGITLA